MCKIWTIFQIGSVFTIILHSSFLLLRYFWDISINLWFTTFNCVKQSCNSGGFNINWIWSLDSTRTLITVSFLSFKVLVDYYFQIGSDLQFEKKFEMSIELRDHAATNFNICGTENLTLWFCAGNQKFEVFLAYEDHFWGSGRQSLAILGHFRWAYPKKGYFWEKRKGARQKSSWGVIWCLLKNFQVNFSWEMGLIESFP